MTRAVRQDPDYPLIMINAADKQFKVGNWLTARNLYELARKHAACTDARKAECEDMITEIDRITTGGSRQIRLELIDVDKLSDIDRLKMFFDDTTEEIKAERYKVLKKSIEERGILVPIDVAYVVEAKTRDEKDEIGDNLKETAWKILDGYTRVQIAKELGITQVRAFIHSAQFIKNDAKAADEKGDPLVNYGLRINVKRRQMTQEEKDKVINALKEGKVVGVGGRPKKGDEKARAARVLQEELGMKERASQEKLQRQKAEEEGIVKPGATREEFRAAIKKLKKVNGLAQTGTLKQGPDADYMSNGWSSKVAFAMREFLNDIKEMKEVEDRNIKEVTFKFEIALFKED